jgi:hypothetical protein
MRVYRAPRVRRPWSDEDRARAAFLFDEGKTNAEIANALGRKPDAVRAWIHHYMRIPKPISVIDYPKAKIAESQVEQFYLLGWRFVGSEGGLHVFEWRASGEPRWPEAMRSAA